MPTWPTSLSINAWIGQTAGGQVAEEASRWVLRSAPPTVRTFLKAPPRADPNNWRDERVGWGLILRDQPGLSDEALATAADAPPPIQRLLEARQPAPVFRYQPDAPNRFRLLRNSRDGKSVALSGAPVGIGPGALPRYLLIYGEPEDVPWELQYILNTTCAVGRLALTGQALDNYVSALIEDWSGAAARRDHALVWSVDHAASDISHLMRDSIAAKLYSDLAADDEVSANAVFIDGDRSSTAATSEALVDALAAGKPGFIVTTSHGQTMPLDDPQKLAAGLGLPIDQNKNVLRLDVLRDAWQPEGAIWYAHACCSAGSDTRTIFDGLVVAGSPVDNVLKGVAAGGASVAPLPSALLGAAKPLRAFVGHVEPTFDWTLREKSTGQDLTAPIREALYGGLYGGDRLGQAMRSFYEGLASHYVSYESALRAFNEGASTRPSMLYSLLAARDIQTMVILGDPTARLG